MVKSNRWGVDVGWAITSHPLKGRSIENIDHRGVVIADRQLLTVRAKCDALWVIFARGLDRLADAAKVRAVAVGVVRVKTNLSVIGSCRETTVTREICAVAVVSIVVVAERLAPILVPVEDPQAFTCGKRRGEVATVRRENKELRDFRQILVNSSNQVPDSRSNR